jgi:hypothetical protein
MNATPQEPPPRRGGSRAKRSAVTSISTRSWGHTSPETTPSMKAGSRDHLGTNFHVGRDVPCVRQPLAHADVADVAATATCPGAGRSALLVPGLTVGHFSGAIARRTALTQRVPPRGGSLALTLTKSPPQAQAGPPMRGLVS